MIDLSVFCQEILPSALKNVCASCKAGLLDDGLEICDLENLRANGTEMFEFSAQDMHVLKGENSV